MDWKNCKVAIIGGSSGIGLASAELFAQNGAQVIIGGRDQARLDAALACLPEGVKAQSVDFTKPESLADFFAVVGRFDHLLLTAGGARHQMSFRQVDLGEARTAFEGKFWGQFAAAQLATKYLRPEGSITFVSGAAGRRAWRDLSVVAAMNAALDGLTRSLALELAPIRVNSIAPGVTDTPFYATLPEQAKEERFAFVEANLPTHRVGHPKDVAEAAVFLAGNGYMTGVTLDVDGGAGIAPLNRSEETVARHLGATRPAAPGTASF
jgi:NAD(P)-dependent dehydrogenase (short-subunit alcohol dehydrogenase family)